MIEWLKIGLSGFIINLITILITWGLTAYNYKKQIAHQIYVGPVLKNLYSPLIGEYKRVVKEQINQGNDVLNIKLLLEIISNNYVLLDAIPKKISKRIKLIEQLCLSQQDFQRFEHKSTRIMSELKKLKDELANIYKEFVYE